MMQRRWGGAKEKASAEEEPVQNLSRTVQWETAPDESWGQASPMAQYSTAQHIPIQCSAVQNSAPGVQSKLKGKVENST